MSASASVPTVQNIPDKPHQPSANYNFPKRTFGQKKPVSRSFQSPWFSQWPFLHYNEANDVAYCHTCLLAFKQRKMSKHNADPALVSKVVSIKKILTFFNKSAIIFISNLAGDQRIQHLEGWNRCFPKP